MPANESVEVTEPLIQTAGREESAQPAEHLASASASDDAAALPSQTGTIKILALVLVVVAVLVTIAALVSRSGVVQIGGPPPECRKSASLAVLRQEQAAHSSNAGLLQLIVWGGKGKKAGLVFDDSHVLNLQNRKWHSVHQKAGLLLNSLRTMPGLRNIWKSSTSQQLLQTDPARLPSARWKQLSVTDPTSSSMVVFGGDGIIRDQNRSTSRHSYLNANSDGYDASGNGHNYFNDAWQVRLYRGKARWQQLWNTETNGTAPEPRRAAAGALVTTNSRSSTQVLIHGGRLEAGHILDDLWHATLGAGNITYQQLWPPQTEDLLGKKRKAPGPAARKGHVAVAVDDPDPCLVIFGGRNGIGYFSDVWAYRLSTAMWEEWTPNRTESSAPMGRDHFGAVYDAGHMYIYGGRGGSTYGKSKALGDVWRFTVASRSWTQLTASGRAPLPRFLFSYDILYPVLHQSVSSEQNSNLEGLVKVNMSHESSSGFHASSAAEAASHLPRYLQGTELEMAIGALGKRPAGSMVVFGGESLGGCYLNDVWVLHLNSLMWTELSKPVACQKRCRSMIEQN